MNTENATIAKGAKGVRMTRDKLLAHLYEKRAKLEIERNSLGCKLAIIQRKMNECTLKICELEHQ